MDPGEAQPVLSYITDNNLTLEAILITHHHSDHTAGIPRLLDSYPNIPVYGPAGETIRGVTEKLKEGDSLQLFKGALTLNVLDIPGHTKGHIAYYSEHALFSGDTLFSCGCGKIFEGTPEQMFASIAKLKALPGETLLYCGHEYTLSNIAFAMHVDPNNLALKQRYKNAKEAIANNLPTLPVTLDIEQQTNPFLRCPNATIFADLRESKNRFNL